MECARRRESRRYCIWYENRKVIDYWELFCIACCSSKIYSLVILRDLTIRSLISLRIARIPILSNTKNKEAMSRCKMLYSHISSYAHIIIDFLMTISRREMIGVALFASSVFICPRNWKCIDDNCRMTSLRFRITSCDTTLFRSSNSDNSDR